MLVMIIVLDEENENGSADILFLNFERILYYDSCTYCYEADPLHALSCFMLLLL